MVVIARADAVAVEGLDSAIDRMHQYMEAGADVAFIQAPARSRISKSLRAN